MAVLLIIYCLLGIDNSGPIIIIEDDKEDQEIFVEVFTDLAYPNKLKFFEDGHSALKYLNGDGGLIDPFLVLPDINMPKIDGYDLRDKIRTRC